MLTEEKLRQENRQLIEMNRRLEVQKDECQAKLDLIGTKRQEQINKLNQDMQVCREKKNPFFCCFIT
jgi:hypothetical protein